MLVAVERLLIKVRQPQSRADELIDLRARLRVELAATIDDDERALARAVHARKLAVVEELRGVTSCASCDAEGPHAGGACCAGVTAELFDDNELAALAHAGTRPKHLVAPRSVHAGCAFRGARGCTLAIDHRPARCVHYACDTLRRELHARGRLDAVEEKLAALNTEMQRFTAVHRARADRDVLAPIFEAIVEATRSPSRRGKTS